MTTLSSGRLAWLACVLEASARKPGNVHRAADLPGLTYADFLRSAGALVGPMDRAEHQGIGHTILHGIAATRRVVETNTNLGMVLLLAPLAAVPPSQPDLRAGVVEVLDRLTVRDAELAYEAIRLAQPGGLGSAPDQDVAAQPTVTLREAMGLAAHRDLVARQYVNAFEEVFAVILPPLRNAPDRGLEQAILTAYLTLLAREPDSLIARKHGPEVAIEVSRRAQGLVSRSTVDPEDPDVREFDHWLRARTPPWNPGTTADLVAAGLYAVLREGTIIDPGAEWPLP